MKKIINCLLILMFFIPCISLADNTYNREKDSLKKTYMIELNQEQEFEKNLLQLFDENGFKYQLEDIKKDYQESIESKVETKEKQFNSSHGNYKDLYNSLEKSMTYEQDNFKGQLDLVDIKIKTIDNGSHEELRTLEKQYNDLKESDLNNIPKELVSNNLIYYLTSCNWEIIQTNNTLGIDVPSVYVANTVYQAIEKVKNPNTYSIRAIYKGEVTKSVTTNILYEITYTGTKIPVEENKNNPPLPLIIGTGIVIIIVPLFLFFFLPNTKIYYLENDKYILIKKVRVRKKKPSINLSHMKSGTYKIEFNPSIGNKMVTIYKNTGNLSENAIINNEIIVNN